MQETWVRSLGWEDLLEKEMATLSSILAWEIPWTEGPGIILGGSKITADGDCSHEVKRYLLFGRKAMTNLDSIAETLLCYV